MGKSDQSNEKEVIRRGVEIEPCMRQDDDDDVDGCGNKGKEEEGDDSKRSRLLASFPNKEPESTGR
jgi:hypothetical protein